MEYMSCPEAARNGEFQKDGYKNYVKKTAYLAFQKIGYMWLITKRRKKTR